MKLQLLKFLYNLFLFIYPKVAWLIRNQNAKAKLWLDGRKNIFEKLEAAFANNTSKIIWIHCSSLGEFEQGRPVIESFKQQYAQFKILITFFSPSGYEAKKNDAVADWIFYLPMDSSIHAKKFFDIVQPKIIFFIKYEYWFYYLTEAKKRNIPLLLVSGIFRKEQVFFKWYGNFYKNMLHCFTHFFVQTKISVELLQNIGFEKNISICGDTRFDRVITIANQFTSIPLIEQFIANNKVIVAGSTWTEDDEELNHYANTHPEIKFIIAPHDVDEERINECKKLYKNAILFSRLSTQPSTTANVLIIDNIGMLSNLYKYATICYIGGGFGEDGVHNVLEAAVYNKPVIFGPEYDKYIEAVELINEGGAYSIENSLELEAIFNLLFTNEEQYHTTAKKAGDFIIANAGATQKIIAYIQENRLLTI